MQRENPETIQEELFEETLDEVDESTNGIDKGGWVKIHRRLLGDDDLWKRPRLFTLFIYLLTHASYRPLKAWIHGERKEFPPGSIVIGYSRLGQILGISRAGTHRGIEKLITRGSIEKISGKEGTIVSICNWDKYQNTQEKGGKISEKIARRYREDSENLQEEKKRRKNTCSNVKTKMPAPRRSPFVEYSTEFVEIYDLYPRKEGKLRGYELFQKSIGGDEALRQKLIIAIQKYSDEVSDREQKHIKHFSSFMNVWTEYYEKAMLNGHASDEPRVYSVDDLEGLKKAFL